MHMSSSNANKNQPNPLDSKSIEQKYAKQLLDEDSMPFDANPNCKSLQKQ